MVGAVTTDAVEADCNVTLVGNGAEPAVVRGNGFPTAGIMAQRSVESRQVAGGLDAGAALA